MAPLSNRVCCHAFALFAALDLGCLLALSGEAIGEARRSDPADLLIVFAGMQAVAICGLLLLATWGASLLLEQPTRMTMRWLGRPINVRIARQEYPHGEA